MKSTLPAGYPPQTLVLSLAFATFALCAGQAMAAAFSLSATDPGGTSSFTNPLTGGATGWPGAPTAGNTYSVGGGASAIGLRGPTSGSFTFAGDSLTLLANGRLLFKTAAATVQTLTVNNLILNGGVADLANASGSGSAATLAGAISLGANSGSGGIGALTGETLTVSSTIGGSGLLVFGGSGVNAGADTGTVILTGSNNNTGGVAIRSGTVTIGSGGTLGASTGALTVENPNTGAGTNVILNLATGADTTTGSLSGAIATPSSGSNSARINTQSGRNFTVNQTTAGTYAGRIDGAGSLTLGSLSTSTLTLSSGASTFTGNILVSAGTLKAATANVNSGNPIAGILGNTTVTRTITVNSGATLEFAIGNVLGTGTYNPALITTNLNGGTLTNTSGDTQTLGIVNLNGGTITASSGTGNSSFQSYVLNQTVTATGTTQSTLSTTGTTNAGYHLGVGTNKTVTFNVDPSGTGASLLVSAPLIGGSGTGGGASGSGIVKDGGGVLTLSGINTYTGTTTVANGKLALGIGSSIANSSTIDVRSGATLDSTSQSGWTLATGQTLKGTGSVDVGLAKTLTIGGGAFLAPGASLGTIGVTGSLSFAAGSTFTAEISPTTFSSDRVNVGGALVIDSSAVLALTLFGSDTVLPDGTKFVLVGYTTPWDGVSTFSGYADDSNTAFGLNTYRVDYNDPSLGGTALTLTVVPEPAALLLGGLGVLTLLRRRRNS